MDVLWLDAAIAWRINFELFFFYKKRLWKISVVILNKFNFFNFMFYKHQFSILSSHQTASSCWRSEIGKFIFTELWKYQKCFKEEKTFGVSCKTFLFFFFSRLTQVAYGIRFGNPLGFRFMLPWSLLLQLRSKK